MIVFLHDIQYLKHRFKYNMGTNGVVEIVIQQEMRPSAALQ